MSVTRSGMFNSQETNRLIYYTAFLSALTTCAAQNVTDAATSQVSKSMSFGIGLGVAAIALGLAAYTSYHCCIKLPQYNQYDAATTASAVPAAAEEEKKAVAEEKKGPESMELDSHEDNDPMAHSYQNSSPVP